MPTFNSSSGNTGQSSSVIDKNEIKDKNYSDAFINTIDNFVKDLSDGVNSFEELSQKCNQAQVQLVISQSQTTVIDSQNIDNTPPVLSVSNQRYTKDKKPKITINSNETALIEYSGNIVGNISNIIAGSNQVTLQKSNGNDLDDGTYNISVIVRDLKNNKTLLNIPTFTIDTTNPVIESFTNILNTENTDFPKFKINVSDNVFTQANQLTLTVKINSSTHKISFSEESNFTTSLNLTSGEEKEIFLEKLPIGSYKCEISVKDFVENQVTKELDDFEIKDTVNPVINIVTGLSQLINNNNPEIVLSSSEQGTVSYSGSASGNLSNVSSGNNTIKLQKNNGDVLDDGLYNDIKITVKDSSNNESTVDLSPFTVDTTPPVFVSTVMDSNNSFMTVSFSENVYSSSNLNPISPENFTLKLSSNNGTNLLSNKPSFITDVNDQPITAGGKVFKFGINKNDNVNANGTEVITIVPNDIFDEAGNNMLTTQNNNTANLFDESLPFINNSIISSDNSTITVTFSEPVFKQNGQSLDISNFDINLLVSGNISDLKMTNLSHTENRVFSINITFNGLPNGSEKISITPKENSIFDSDNLSAKTNQDNNEVILNDKTLPSIVKLSLVSSNNINTVAKTDDLVTLTIESDEEIQKPTVEFKSNNISVTSTVQYVSENNNKTWKASYSVNTNDSSGNVTFILSNIKDIANNSIPNLNQVTDGTSVLIDNLAPTITMSVPFSTINNLQKKSNQTISFTTTGVSNGRKVILNINDNGNNILNKQKEVNDNTASIEITTEDFNKLNDSTTYTITADISDLAGNNAIQQSHTFNTDFTDPSVNSLSLSWGGNENTPLNSITSNVDGSVTINLTGVENNQNLKLTLNNKEYNGVVVDNKSTVVIPKNDLKLLQNGNYLIKINNLTDLSGNIAQEYEQSFTVNNSEIINNVTANAGKFLINGQVTPSLTLTRGVVYIFNQSDSSNSNHPFKFSTTENGTHNGGSEFNYKVFTHGNPGDGSSYVRIVIDSDTTKTPATLYYYCKITLEWEIKLILLIKMLFHQ